MSRIPARQAAQVCQVPAAHHQAVPAQVPPPGAVLLRAVPRQAPVVRHPAVPVLLPVPAQVRRVPAMILTGRAEAESWGFQMAGWCFIR